MSSYWISPKDEKVNRVIRAAFPDYNGNKCRVEFTESSVNMSSYWDGGTRSYFAIVRLSDCQVMSIPQQSAYDKQLRGVDSFDIPAGFVVVEHIIFCGKDMGLKIHARADGSNLLPEATTGLTELETRVLIATASRKSSYAGISDYRYSELKRKYGYTLQEVNSARESLINKGMLTGNKSITVKGRNAIENHRERHSF
jgi:hypothetical protein